MGNNVKQYWEDNKNTINYEVLKPNNYVASHYSLYKLYEDALLDPINELSQKEELKAPKDTAARVINFSIPKTQSDLPERYKHDKTDHDVALLVKYVDPLTDNNINEELSESKFNEFLFNRALFFMVSLCFYTKHIYFFIKLKPFGRVISF